MEDPTLGAKSLTSQGQAIQLADNVEQRLTDNLKPEYDSKLFDLYIPSLAKKPGAQTAVNVLEAIQDFIDDPQRLSLLVLGDSGLGKSTLAKYLTQLLWREYDKDSENNVLPILINLPAIDSSKRLKHLLHAHLKKQGLERKEERLLLNSHRLLLILDGYDEIPEHENLWLKNGWSVNNIKVITFCRPEVLLNQAVGGYQALFYPPLPTHLLAAKAQSLQELTLQPFTSGQIDQYLQHYVQQISGGSEREDKEDKGKEKEESEREGSCSQPALLPWSDWQTYRHYIDSIPGLKALVETPFILSMVVQVLPEVIANEYGLNEKPSDKTETPASSSAPQIKPLTRTQIYDYFVSHWFSYQAQRIEAQDKGLPALNISLAHYLRIYTENLAHRLLRAGKLEIIVSEEDSLDLALLIPRDQDYALAYAKDKNKFTPELLAIIRSGCLLKTAGGQFSFLHKSLLEYFAANDVFSSLVAGADFILHSVKNEQGGKGKGLEGEWQVATFNEQLLVDERGILRVLADRVKQDPAFKTLLFGIIEYSKGRPEVGIAASNAITVLNQAGTPLSGQDFKGIHIPGADLSGALLSGSDFSRSNLSGVRLHQAHLAYADFSYAHLKDISFGQLPSLSHKAGIRSLCYSPDGKWLATGDTLGHIYIWSKETSKCQRILKNWRNFSSKNNPVLSLSFHPTELLLAAGSKDHLIRLWQVEQGKCIAILAEHTWSVTALAFSPNGQILASGALSAVCLWPLSEQPLLEGEFGLLGHTSMVNSLAFSPDGQMLASGCEDRVRLWQVSEQRLLAELRQASHHAGTLVFSSDGQVLAAGDQGKIVRLWQVREQRLQAEFGHTNFVEALAFSSDGQYLASASNKTVCLWQVREQRLQAELRGHTSSVRALAFSPDGQTLASGSDNDTVRLWQVSNQQLLRELNGHSDELNRVAFSPGKRTSLTISSDGQTLASGGDDNTLRLWQVSNQRLLGELCGHTSSVKALAFSPDGQTLASGGTDKTVRLWQVSNQSLQRELHEHTSSVIALAFSPDGQTLASGGEDQTVCLWQVSEQRLLGKFQGRMHMTEVVFSPDGQMLASGSYDRVYLWQVSNQRLLGELRGYTGGVHTLVFSPDGQMLASGSKTVCLWQVSEQRLLGECRGHTKWVETLAFSPDRKILASGSRDRTVRLWRLDTLHCIAILPHGNDEIKALYWQRDASQLTVIDSRMHKFVWRLPSPQQPRYILLQTTSSYPLTCTGMNIAHAIGLSPSNIALLHQQGAFGTPSKRPTFYSGHSRLLELPDVQSHNAVTREQVFSAIDSRLPVFYDSWVVSLLRHPHSRNPDHAILILEGLSAFGKSIFVKLHLVDSDDIPGQGRILISTYPNIAKEDREDVLKRDIIKQQTQGTFYSKSWSLAREQALSLFSDAKADQDKTIEYHVSGDRSLLAQSSSSSHEDRIVHNCFTWAREKLHNLNDKRIQLPPKPTDRLGAKTSFYIGPEQEDKSTCLMM